MTARYVLLLIATRVSSLAVAAASRGSKEGQRQGLEILRQKADDVISQMTLEEKVSLLHGIAGPYVGNTPAIPRLGIPALTMNDGPQGFRDDAHPGTTTMYPSGGTVSSSFDRDLLFSWGQAMGGEFYDKGANVQLGPGMNLARVPTNGRNFEYLSGCDPYLGYVLAQSAIEGIQSRGVIANAKHWVENNQETDRETVSEEVDERTRHELYYLPFRGAVEAGVGSFMCSYNKVNGAWSCENDETLRRDLKETLGFDGWIMSDWGATHSTSILQGLDQEMPGGFYFGDALLKQVQEGLVDESAVDDSVKRIIMPMLQMGILGAATPNTNTLANNVTSQERSDVAMNIAAETHVLLKNEGNLLPFSTAGPIKIAIMGKGAVAPIVGGGGSGSVFPAHVVTPYEGLLSHLGLLNQVDASMSYECGEMEHDVGIAQWGCESSPAASAEECCAICGGMPLCEYWVLSGSSCNLYPSSAHKKSVGYKGSISGSANKKMPPTAWSCSAQSQCVAFIDGSDVEAAAALALEADVTVIVVGTFAKEASDRNSLSFAAFTTEDCNVVPEGQDELISKVSAATQGKVVVAMTAPGAVLMPWKDQVSSILWGGFPGQEYGRALASVLFGATNPSGRLPFTMPNKENEMGFNPSQYPGIARVGNYSERMLVDYRWYQSYNVKPSYAFGHGLSYTTFAYSSLLVTGRTVSVVITNTGAVAGKDTVQCYLEFPAAAKTPPLQLKAFAKTQLLPPQASQTLSFTLRDADLSVWDVDTHAWKLVDGQFGVRVGPASDNLPLESVMAVP